jgi:hypothetical protein
VNRLSALAADEVEGERHQANQGHDDIAEVRAFLTEHAYPSRLISWGTR